MIEKAKVDELETLTGQLKSIHTELAALSKKSPNDAVNKFKLEFVNAVISRCNAFLAEAYRPFKEFHTFDLEAVMSNSDVTFMVSLYLEALEKCRCDNIKLDFGRWYYDMPKGQKISAAPPAKLKV